VATQPLWILILFQNLFQRTTSHDAARIMWSVCCSGDVNLVV